MVRERALAALRRLTDVRQSNLTHVGPWASHRYETARPLLAARGLHSSVLLAGPAMGIYVVSLTD
jgi:hypothetical protein